MLISSFETLQDPKGLEDLTGLTELMRGAADCLMESEDDTEGDIDNEDFVEL